MMSSSTTATADALEFSLQRLEDLQAPLKSQLTSLANKNAEKVRELQALLAGVNELAIIAPAANKRQKMLIAH